ncbi:MAG: TraB/GumN family protein [Deltaproteobacteria bacterium]|nr:TraB/GumN family protein [Deltaproteobacteria bacterium]
MRALAIVLCVVIGACATARPRCALVTYAQPRDAVFAWRVQRVGAPGTVILYGTIHTATLSDVPVEALRALDGVTRFASELGDVEPDPGVILDLARLPFGQVLDQLLPADDWWELETAMRGAIKPDDLKRARPWFALIRLMARVAPAPKPSMDVALATRARTRGVPVDPLETWQDQMTALDASVTIADLSGAIRARHTFACSQTNLLASYAARDTPRLTQLLRVGDASLIAKRNATWLPRLEQYVAQDGTTFVAVGLGHLLGDDGLPAMLARAGYTITR